MENLAENVLNRTGILIEIKKYFMSSEYNDT